MWLWRAGSSVGSSFFDWSLQELLRFDGSLRIAAGSVSETGSGVAMGQSERVPLSIYLQFV